VSGGRYDYLCWAAGDVADLANKRTVLGEMAERLAGLNPEGHAAADTYEVLAILAAAAHASRRLEGVWHAVEWRDSRDWDDERMQGVLDAYERERAAEEHEDA
jgi:hypothetical protein